MCTTAHVFMNNLNVFNVSTVEVSVNNGLIHRPTLHSPKQRYLKTGQATPCPVENCIMLFPWFATSTFTTSNQPLFQIMNNQLDGVDSIHTYQAQPGLSNHVNFDSKFNVMPLSRLVNFYPVRDTFDHCLS